METNRPHVAIVENDDSFGEALDRLLRASGFDSALYPSAERFLDCGKPEAIDCLLLDVHLPGASGFDLLTRLSGAGVPVPVLLMSADDSGALRRRASQSECREFLTKPFEAPALLDAIRRCLTPASIVPPSAPASISQFV